MAVLPVVPRSISPAGAAGVASACSHILGAASLAHGTAAPASLRARETTAPDAETLGRAVSVAAARVADAARAAGHSVVLLDRAVDVRKAVTVSRAASPSSCSSQLG